MSRLSCLVNEWCLRRIQTSVEDFGEGTDGTGRGRSVGRRSSTDKSEPILSVAQNHNNWVILWTAHDFLDLASEYDVVYFWKSLSTEL